MYSLISGIAKTRRSRGRLAAVGAAVVVLGGVACSAANIERAASSVAPGAKATQPGAPAAVPAPAGFAGGPPAIASDAAQRSAPTTTSSAAPSTAAMEPSAAQTLDRMIIRTAQLMVEVMDMENALAQARQIAARGGGFVSASNTRVEKINDQDRTVADVTIQVRSDAADAVLSDLRALGKVTAETSGSQDVTEEYVDLDSNLRNLQATESAILKLMDKATRIEDIVSLQRELTTIRGQIERIQGRKRFLERRSDMATITLGLRLPPLESTRPLIGGAWDPFAVAARAWAASLAVLRGIAEVVIVVLAFSWWLIPIIGLGVYVWVHRRRVTPTAPPTAA
jgi:Domain of unknown function (DUF4349)